MSSISLSQRIQSLSTSYKTTLSLIQELQKFPTGSNQSDDLDEQRLELANTCHDSLKEAEESLETLKQDLEALDTPSNRRRALSTARDEDFERHSTAVTRLSDDIRGARGAFRRAQLQSKKNLDLRKQKDREQLFANRRSGVNSAPVRQKVREKLTQDELNQNAAEDVTKALRRTHALMSSNLKQSQFAQQALDESQEQLKGLGDQYLGTTEILQKSRGLVKTLLTSQKSDTWYLQTSVYILLATISWLVFRRLLYGPLWWLVYLPMRWLWWGVMLPFRSSGATTSVIKNNTLLSSSKIGPGMAGTTTQVQWHSQGLSSESLLEDDELPSPEMIEKVKKMIKDADGRATWTEEESQQRNPKKRMMEADTEQQRIRDEL